MTALDTSWSIKKLGFLYKGFARFFLHQSLQTSFLSVLRSQRAFSSSSMSLIHSFIIHFIFYDLTFGVCWKIWGFSNLKRFLQNFWDGICFNDPKCSCIALHLHFNYIFMHYSCVLYMLNCCVLLGLDWDKPMMLLILHVTCSCIFMHMYLHFLIFLYWSVLVLFCFSFYALTCSMSPKHKSTPSQNLLRSKASSSSSPSVPTPFNV